MARDDRDEESFDDDADDLKLDDDSLFQTEADVTCPYCGEGVQITLDPDGGEEQEYVQDCEVCCRPWRVHVAYDDEGAADVSVDTTE
jgi:hypothetical protein